MIKRSDRYEKQWGEAVDEVAEDSRLRTVFMGGSSLSCGKAIGFLKFPNVSRKPLAVTNCNIPFVFLLRRSSACRVSVLSSAISAVQLSHCRIKFSLTRRRHTPSKTRNDRSKAAQPKAIQASPVWIGKLIGSSSCWSRMRRSLPNTWISAKARSSMVFGPRKYLCREISIKQTQHWH